MENYLRTSLHMRAPVGPSVALCVRLCCATCSSFLKNNSCVHACFFGMRRYNSSAQRGPRGRCSAGPDRDALAKKAISWLRRPHHCSWRSTLWALMARCLSTPPGTMATLHFGRRYWTRCECSRFFREAFGPQMCCREARGAGLIFANLFVVLKQF